MLIRCEKVEKSEKGNIEATDHYSVDLTAGLHTTFVDCDLVPNEKFGDTQTALFRAVPLSSEMS